jgi:dTDP-4-dehydrorhamnose reductase
MYEEADFADADDVYGRTKLLGEVTGPGAITLRTSIIGLELSRKKSLIEWYLAQKGSIHGFRNAIYSGFTTLEMARIIEKLLLHHPDAQGLYHCSSEPIDKYTLLQKLNVLLGSPLEITENTDFFCERSLRSERFRSDFDYTPPSWPDMLEELATQIKERY